MANITISWTPAGGVDSVDQTVQYRLQGSSTWIDTDDSPLAPTVDTTTIEDLLENEVYEFRIVNNCAGGSVSTPYVESAILTCTDVSIIDLDYNSGTYSFTDLGGDVSSYVIQLLDGAGTSVLSSQTKLPPFAGTISGSFGGLTSNTTYNIRVIVNVVGSFNSYTKTDCALVPFTTDEITACLAPSDVSVEWTPEV